MTLLTQIFGRKKPTADAIFKEIAAMNAKEPEVRARLAAAEAALGNLSTMTDAEHAAADAEKAQAHRALKRHQARVADLQTAHAAQVKVEEREAFRAEIAAHQAEEARLAARVAEYPALAAALAALCNDLQRFADRKEKLLERGRDLGERVEFGNPEACRRAAVRWSVTYPNPDGPGVIKGDAESAPRGMLRWVEGKPVPAAEGVTVSQKGGEGPDSLVSTVSLPGLRYGDPALYDAPEELPACPVPGLGRV